MLRFQLCYAICYNSANIYYKVVALLDDSSCKCIFWLHSRRRVPSASLFFGHLQTLIDIRLATKVEFFSTFSPILNGGTRRRSFRKPRCFEFSSNFLLKEKL